MFKEYNTNYEVLVSALRKMKSNRPISKEEYFAAKDFSALNMKQTVRRGGTTPYRCIMGHTSDDEYFYRSKDKRLCLACYPYLLELHEYEAAGRIPGEWTAEYFRTRYNKQWDGKSFYG